jgi:hypothetical protein
MLKIDIIKKITTGVGDPQASVYKDRAWHYFVQALFELAESLTNTEKTTYRGKRSGTISTNASGEATIQRAVLPLSTQIEMVLVNGVVASEIDEKEYKMMTSNSLYAPSGNEAYYYHDVNQIIVLTARYGSTIYWEIRYLIDPEAEYATAPDGRDITIPNSLIYRAAPLALERLKAEIGITL